jgi:hypothetical protein
MPSFWASKVCWRDVGVGPDDGCQDRALAFVGLPGSAGAFALKPHVAETWESSIDSTGLLFEGMALRDVRAYLDATGGTTSPVTETTAP